MKRTAAQSARLKQVFKTHFRDYGYWADLSPALAKERELFPNEWAEACQEFPNEVPYKAMMP